MSEILELVNGLYVYCTDFVINLANLLNLSYYELNFLFFCILYPLLLGGTFTVFILQSKRLRKLQRSGQPRKLPDTLS